MEETVCQLMRWRKLRVRLRMLLRRQMHRCAKVARIGRMSMTLGMAWSLPSSWFRCRLSEGVRK